MIFKIKLASVEASSELLMLLHKKTNMSLSEIKNACKKNAPVYECGSADTDGLITLNNLRREIESLGHKAVLFIDEKEVDAQVFANIEKRNIEIDETFDALD